VFIAALTGSMIGYVVYNTGVIFGFFHASQVGVFGCVQSLGTIGCGDTINGLIYSVVGGMMAGLLVWTVRYKLG
jgi:hypothetical protein